MKNLLVTGGAGFIGSNFIRFILLAEPDIRVINLDLLTYAGSIENLKDLPDEKRHVLVQGDICDKGLVQNVFETYQIDTVVHFAAESHVDRSILDPGLFIQTNVVGTFTLLEAARIAWKSPDETIHRFHHVSTDEVYGTLQPDEPAWKEDIPYKPNSPYAASKAASDHLVRAYHHTYHLPVSITNCSNNYGPNQFPEKLIPLMILNCLSGQNLPVYGDGKQIRDWLYVEDHCEAILKVLRKGAVGETYNIGGSNQPENITIIRNLCEIFNEVRPESVHAPHEHLIEHVFDRPGHDRRYAMDSTKIRANLGWSPRHSLNQGLLKTVEWYLSHPEWISAIESQNDYQLWMHRNYQSRGENK